MVVIPDLKHNGFKEVTIPRPSELVRAYGLNRPGTRFSEDEVIAVDKNKVEQVASIEKEMFEPEK